MKLYNQLIRYPSEVIPLLDSVATDVYADINDVAATDILTSIQVRPYNLQFVKTMRTLSPSDVGNLINLRGMVVR
ncbi:mcm-4, partial [Symbiodinium sp. KB8]